MVVATCYTLFFVPVMYSMLRRKAPAKPVDDDGAGESAETQAMLVPEKVLS